MTTAVYYCQICRSYHESGTFCPIPGSLPQATMTGNPICCAHCEIHTELMREVLTTLQEIKDRLPPNRYNPDGTERDPAVTTVELTALDTQSSFVPLKGEPFKSDSRTDSEP